MEPSLWVLLDQAVPLRDSVVVLIGLEGQGVGGQGEGQEECGRMTLCLQELICLLVHYWVPVSGTASHTRRGSNDHKRLNVKLVR